MRSHTLAYLSLTLAPTLALGLATTACTVATAPAARPAEAHAMRNGFTYLGERMVNGGADHDVLPVGRGDGRFHEIMVVVERAPVEIFDMVVTFGDGQHWEPHTRMVFGRDTTSRAIDLPGGARVIRRVDFRYGNLGARDAKVELWGR
jgi:hypothetical protein